MQTLRRALQKEPAFIKWRCEACLRRLHVRSHEQTARSYQQEAIQLCLRRAGLAFRRHFAGSVGGDLAAVPRSYARGRSSWHRQAVLSIADPVFRHPRAVTLRDVEHSSTDERWTECSCYRAGAVLRANRTCGCKEDTAARHS